MKPRHILLPALSLVLFAACSENPVSDDHNDDEALNIELSLSSDHLVTLTEMEFEVEITDHDGAPVTDMESVVVEYLFADGTDWKSVELEVHGQHYAADYTFKSSGEYQIRVSGTPHGHADAEVLYTMDDAIHVERIHQEIGGYKIEFETFPGHVHEGGEAEISFFVTQDDNDGHGGHMMGGLHAEIHATDTNSMAVQYSADEHDGPGVYSSHHTFSEAGETQFEFHFEHPNGQEYFVEFHVPVSHAH